MLIDEQVVITLYRFGHYGNAANLMKVALEFVVGFETVHLQVFTTRACFSERFRSSSVQWVCVSSISGSLENPKACR